VKLQNDPRSLEGVIGKVVSELGRNIGERKEAEELPKSTCAKNGCRPGRAFERNARWKNRLATSAGVSERNMLPGKSPGTQ
jgi:hypothetical protein